MSEAPVRLIPLPLRFAVAGLIAAFAAAAVFASTAQVSRTIQVAAAVLPEQGLTIVRAPASGSLSALSPAAGTAVHRSQPIAGFVADNGGPTELLAPADGVLLGDPALPGVRVQAGAALLRLRPAESSPIVELFLSPSQAALVRTGQVVSVPVGRSLARAEIGQLTTPVQDAASVRAQLGLADTAVPAALAGNSPVYVVRARLTNPSDVTGFSSVTTASLALENTTALNVILGRQS
jgi:hypothetical protein